MTQNLTIEDNVRQIFMMRYYRWAIKDIEREVVENFPLIGSMKDASVLRFLETMESLGLEERLFYGKICVRHCFQKTLEQTDECFTTREAEQYILFCRKERSFGHRVMEQRAIHDSSEKLNQKRLRCQIEKELEPILDKPKYKGGSNDFGYRTTMNLWDVNTHIEIGGRNQLSYTHIIIPTSSSELRIKPLACPELLVWLGIGRTSWSLITNSDVEETAKTLARICSHFIQAAPELLSGLTPSSINL